MRKYLTIVFIGMLALISKSIAQPNVLNPADPDNIFTASNHPAVPTYAVISKWGHANRNMGWNTFTSGYKSYYFKGMAFRLKFPKTYVPNVVDNKKYPVFIFLHGLGEPGTIWDNEVHLVHGGELHAAAVDNGTFDGFLLYPQSQSGYLQNYAPMLLDLLDSMVKYNKADIDRVILSGLSSGGQANWDIMQSYPKSFAYAMPISAARYEVVPKFPQNITIPIWLSNGGQDLSPDPQAATYIVDSFRNMGGNIKQSFFPAGGHGIWYNFWAEPGYFAALNGAHKANPLVYFQRNQFCPGITPNAKLALQAGFYAYEWSKDNVTIPGATGNQYTATTFGTYRARFKRSASAAWSDWSPAPVVVSEKPPTITPPIQINGLMSNVLPAPDGNTTVTLKVPNTFASYEWRRVSDNALVSSASTFNAPVGVYKVKVTEQFGCTSAFGPNYTVVPANGTNLPDRASNVTAVAQSNHSIEVNWNDNPTPINNETGFEIYRSLTSGTGFQLINITAANVLTYMDNGLEPDTKYYYLVRAINNTGAALSSLEVHAITKSDVNAPSAPANLIVTGTNRSAVSLSWSPSTDDVGVVRYEVYVNGMKAYATTGTSFTVNGLTALQTYSFYVTAKDATGNVSAPSTQVSAAAALNGLYYRYYQGSWNNLPDFTQLTPVKSGATPNVSLTPRLQNDNFAFLWTGYIKIPVSGSYTFETNSDDGSKLYIGTYDPNATALVNNDGLHGTQYAAGTITLAAGIYPISITFFELSGGEAMNIYWTSNAAGINTRTVIPNSAFADVVPAGVLPAKPSFFNVVATSYKQINLSWTDNSNNETGFEVVRVNLLTGALTPIGTVGAGVTSFMDSVGLSAGTKYYYRIRAVNEYGGSEYVSNVEAWWSFNNNVNDGSGNARTLTRVSSPPYSATDKKEGTHSVSFNGSSQYMTMTFSSSSGFPSNAYSTRTIGLWMKPAAATISGVNKIIFDFGGNDNGLALRFNSGALQAGIADNNVRNSISIANIVTNPSWVNGGWNHVAVVYNVNNLKLFVNGVEKGSLNLPSSDIGTSTSTSRIANTDATNAFNSSATSAVYSGLMDDFIVLSEPLNAAGVTGLMTQGYSGDTTFVLPPVPAAASDLIATAISPSQIELDWADNSSNETGFVIERSVTDANNFRLLAEIPAGNGSDVTYIDTSLFSNTNYYYRVKAAGIGGTSAWTTVAMDRTLNNLPEFAPIADFSMRYASVKNLSIVATDLDGEALTFSFADPLPAFATFTNTSNGVANLQLSPSAANQGDYTFNVIASDGNGGSTTLTFTVTVNSNYVPVVANTGNITVSEGSNANTALSATDQDGNASLVFSLVSPPPFASVTNNGNGSATLSLQPGFAAAGTYPLTVNVTDGAGGVGTLTVNIIVNDVVPPSETVYMSMRYASAPAASPWNNINATNTTGLKNANGVVTTTGIEFMGTGWNAGDAGAVTGNNSGVYPDNVIRDYFWFGIYGAPETITMNLKGLTAGAKYNVTLFGSSSWSAFPDNGTTIYTINGVSKSIHVQGNSQNTVTFTNIIPNASGIISVLMSKAAGTPYGVLTSVVLQKPFDDGTAPVLPVNLAGEALANGSVQLTWTDVAYNESRYLVKRATNAAGPFTVLNPTASNANEVSYLDNNVASNTTYYYKLEATNDNGSSGETNVVSVLTSNKAPILTAAVNDVIMKGGTVNVLNINATDDGSDVITTTVTGLPAFGVYQSTGNGMGTITLSPSVNNLGVYNNVIVTVMDNNGAGVSDTFTITVTDPSIRTVYINYGPEGGTAQATPWNNFMGYPFANYSYTGLKDDAGLNTGFSFRFLTQWTGGLTLGMPTGSNNGVFPDNVISTSIYTTNNGNQTMQFDGLDPAKRYNIGFLNSFNSGNPNVVTYTNGTQSVAVDGKYNSTVLANINGLVPNASGSVQVILSKASAATFLMLNGIVIQEYSASTPIVRPDNLFAETLLKTDQVKLTWGDKSNNETGFEIWRATALNGTYSLVTTTAANVTEYTNTGLTANTAYYYKVRAKNGATLSAYSNTAKIIVANKIVLLSLNVDEAQHAPSPWNSTDAPSTEGATFPDLIDNTTINTGFSMVITKEFNGSGFAGVNGAGIFPANVMVSNYWTDAGQLSQLKIINLDLRKKYRIGVFGSNANVLNATATYSCNGKSIYLNSYNNNSKVVYFDKLVPDADGQIFLDARTTNGSPYSFTGAITIEYFDDNTPPTEQMRAPADSADVIPFAEGKSAPPAAEAVAEQPVAVSELKANMIVKENAGEIKVFPNPFTNRIQVEIEGDKASTVTLLLYDLNARLVYKSAAFNALAGKNVLAVDLPANTTLPPGSYVINVLIDGKMTKSVKLIKVK